MADNQEVDQKPQPNDVISLIVKDQSGTEVHFKVKSHTKLEKVMKAYCEKKSMEVSSVRFLYDGTRLKGDQTPSDLEMQDGDIIDAVIEQIGG